MHPAVRRIIEKTLERTAHPNFKAFVWLADHGQAMIPFEAPSILTGEHRECKAAFDMSCDNFLFDHSIPNECLVFHGICPRCNTVFLVEREKQDERLTFEAFVSNMVKLRNKRKKGKRK